MAQRQIIAQQRRAHAQAVMAKLLNNRPPEFLPQLARFMAQRGSHLPPSLTGVPNPNYDHNTSRFRAVQPGSSPGTFRIADKDVDLHMLLIWVLQRGGAKESTPWEAFVAHAGLPATIPHMIPGQPDIKVSAMIQQYYINLLLPFESIWAKMLTQKIAFLRQQQQQQQQHHQQQQQQQAAMQQGGPANGAQLSNLQGPAGMPSYMHAQANAPAHGFGAISSPQNHQQMQSIQPQQPHALPQQNRSYPLPTQPQPHVYSIQLPRISPRPSTLDLFHSRHQPLAAKTSSTSRNFTSGNAGTPDMLDSVDSKGRKRKRSDTGESDGILSKKVSPTKNGLFPSGLLAGAPFSIRQLPTQDSSAMFGAPNFTGCWTKLKDIPSATGGNSDIYKARLDRGAIGESKLVAVKVLRSIRIRPGCAPEEILKKRLMREMSVWCQLDHENVVPFLGYAFNGTFPCMVAPWYDNGNLPDYIARHPGLDRTRMVLESLNGLLHLHSRDPPVVHGDLKASNILVDDEGHARITDFGLSRIMEEGHTGWTTSTGISGTHRWMAPELLLTERSNPTTEADVYSVTLLVLEIYTGKIPFPHLDAAPFFRAIVAEKSPQRSHYSPFDPPEDVWQVFERGWSFEPDLRPRVEVLKKQVTCFIKTFASWAQFVFCSLKRH
ncbi:hypothetical protein FRC02_010217 [Tulasnella sp. 418]|nr:hypothetical protein FRC02_010217 [Tulasnella sp. 418]